MSKKKNKAVRTVLIRYIITNLFILIIPLLVALVYYCVSSRSIEKSINSIVDLQLDRNIQFIDQRLKGLTEQSSQLLVDYDLNRYLNSDKSIGDIDLYNSRRISSKLSSIVISSDFLSRSFVYLSNSDKVIMDNGFSDYSSFYGTLFTVNGYDALSWKKEIINNYSNEPILITEMFSSEGGISHPSHIYLRPIGSGDYYRGTFVAVINSLFLGRNLTQLPGLYGGWLVVTNSSEDLIACSSIDRGEFLISLIKGKENLNRIIIEKQKYLVYSKISPYNNWIYTAFLNEKMINADLIKVRNTAFILLLIAFLLGVTFSYLLALTNSRPLNRLLNLLKVTPDTGIFQINSLYHRLEESIQKLSDTKKDLEQEVKSTTIASRTYFLQSLLRGEYHNRARFYQDKDRFNVFLEIMPYFVIVCRLSTLAMAMETRNQGEVMMAIHHRLSKNTGEDEFVLPASSGSLVIILRVNNGEDYRNIALNLIDRIFGNIQEGLRENLLFGIGEPVSEPFLLPISYNQGEASSLAITPKQRNPILFYEDFPASAFSYSYPLHVEEAICRAVRGANKEILSSLINGIKEENLLKRTLGNQERENLIQAMRGTALRLLNEFPHELKPFRSILDKRIENPGDDQTLIENAQVLFEMADLRAKKKKSHNTHLAMQIREYIKENYSDYNLGLSSIAKKFNMSENYLSSFFKENVGEGLFNYIQRIRMSEAAELLLTRHEISVEKIGVICGYPHTSSFRRAFKRIYGQSPSEYKNQEIKQEKATP